MIATEYSYSIPDIPFKKLTSLCFFSATATESEIRDLAAELKLMIHLGQHKNIVNLLGACTTGRSLYVAIFMVAVCGKRGS